MTDKERELEKVAELVAGYSDGAYTLATDIDEYLNLSAEDRQAVDDMTSKYVDTCGVCGWYWNTDGLEWHDSCDQPVCWQCYINLEQEAESEE